MTTTQRLKAGLVAYLNEVKPDADITVVDANIRADIELPTLAVAVTNVAPHSVVLAHCQRSTVQITLRTHAGDESMLDVESCIDQLESSLNNPTEIKAIITDQIRLDHWLYNGSTMEWDDNVLEVVFEAECIAARI